MINFTLNQLQYFYKLAQTLNYSRAAEQLSISQPSLSNQIHELEEILGVKIFKKQGRGIILTDAGKDLVIKVTELLNNADSITKAMDNYSNDKMNYIKLGVSGNQNIYRTINIFNLSNHQTHIQMRELSTDEIIYNLFNYKLDAGITVLPINNPMLSSQPILYDELRAVASIDNQNFKNMHHVSLSELTKSSMAVLNQDFYVRNRLDQIFQEHLLMPKYDFELNNYDSCLDLVTNSTLVSIIPQSFLLNTKHANLKIMKLSDEIPKITVGLIYLKSQSLNQAIFELIDEIKKEALLK